jgi:squalene synthase HpnC
MTPAADIEIAAILSGKSGRDENFPVASALIAPRHRQAILGFYRFVRAADDIADHATLAPSTKHGLLDRLEAGLQGDGTGEPEAEPLRLALRDRGMKPRHALDMLVAFRRDIDKPRTDDWADLIDYCRYSAMPVGRFVLDVHGEPEHLWPANDALCAALQILNHMQDCGRDHRDIGRIYLPRDLMERHGVAPADLERGAATPGLRAVLDDIGGRTGELLAESAPFAAGIDDLRLAMEVGVIQGMAERLLGRLKARDPLAESVALGKAGFASAALVGLIALGGRRLFGSPARRAPHHHRAEEPR